MAHPDRLSPDPRPFEEETWLVDVDLRPAVLPMAGGLHLATEQVGGELHAVADSQDRNAEVEDPRIRMGGTVVVHALGAHRRRSGRWASGGGSRQAERLKGSISQ